jgi:aspartyl protease family protein
MPDFPRALKPLTFWLLVGTAVFLGVQVWQARQQETRFQLSGGVIELRRHPDGHFHWPGRLNNKPVEFLVDTGATRTAVPRAWVAELPSEGAVVSSTAGGQVRGDLIRVDLQLEGGPRIERLLVVALEDLPVPLLGMDVLGRVRFSQQDGVLRIELPRS